MNTVQKFESFYGTESYHDIGDGYACSDAIVWLRSKMSAVDFFFLLSMIKKTNKL